MPRQATVGVVAGGLRFAQDDYADIAVPIDSGKLSPIITTKDVSKKSSRLISVSRG
jgi:hypothetical protein